MTTPTLSPAPSQAARLESPTTPVIHPNGRNGESGLNLAAEPNTTNTPKQRTPSLKKVILAAAILVAVVGAAKLAYNWWTVGRFIQTTDDAYIGGDTTVIAPKVSGFIAELDVTDNQKVRAGDLLMKLDDRDYRAALARAQADVELQQATLANLDANRHLQEAVVAQAQADLESCNAEIVRTHDDQARYKKLLTSGAVSSQNFEQADIAYQRALDAGDKAQAALAAAKRQLDVIATQKQQTVAALAAAEASHDLAQLNLGYTELRAPIDGIVGNRSAQVGAYATTGSQLISLVPARGLWIDANFKESQLTRMHPGSPATIEVDEIPGQRFHGHVLSIAPATGAQFSVLPPENATGNFTKIVQRVTVRIQLDDETAAPGQLRPGLSVTARVDTRSHGNLDQ